MVLHLADKTSASTTSAANSMLATSENVACNGCAWKCRPRSVRVRMASLPAKENGITQRNLPPLRYKIPVEIRLQTQKNCSNNRALQLQRLTDRLGPNPYPATASALSGGCLSFVKISSLQGPFRISDIPTRNSAPQVQSHERVTMLHSLNSLRM